MKDFRINPSESERKREIRICQSPIAERETLYLSLINNVWHADSNETSERAYITGLFGTAILPTPFTGEADRQEVITTIAKLNPQYNVVVR